MGSIRQNKIEAVIQEELASIFQRHAREICLGAMVSVTVVRVTADLSLARIYVSIFGGPDKEEVLQSIQDHTGRIKRDVGKRLRNMRKIPDLQFKIDDSLDYAQEIDDLLSKK
ncbi:MAG: 30S ribosome-binding factor RbfA [Bacteroidetes bacterium]|nr:MAG: 30S ribosome-binding factor RbfA [Bacteroidota bacterium]